LGVLHLSSGPVFYRCVVQREPYISHMHWAHSERKKRIVKIRAGLLHPLRKPTFENEEAAIAAVVRPTFDVSWGWKSSEFMMAENSHRRATGLELLILAPFPTINFWPPVSPITEVGKVRGTRFWFEASKMELLPLRLKKEAARRRCSGKKDESISVF